MKRCANYHKSKYGDDIYTRATAQDITLDTFKRRKTQDPVGNYLQRYCESSKELKQVGFKPLSSKYDDEEVNIDAIEHPYEEEIMKHRFYAEITNNVVTLQLRKPDGPELNMDHWRIPLYNPNCVRNPTFAAVICPKDNKSTVLIFSKLKLVMTGETTPESTVSAFHRYRLMLESIPHPMMVTDVETNERSLKMGYLTFMTDFCNYKIQNTVGSGPLTKENEIIDLAKLARDNPEYTNWNPEVFPGLKWKIPQGNVIVENGAACTAHIFEQRAVMMGLPNANSLFDLYRYFIIITRPYTKKYTAKYDKNKYGYRYDNMMYRLKERRKKRKKKEMLASKRMIARRSDISTLLNKEALNRKNNRSSLNNAEGNADKDNVDEDEDWQTSFLNNIRTNENDKRNEYLMKNYDKFAGIRDNRDEYGINASEVSNDDTDTDCTTLEDEKDDDDDDDDNSLFNFNMNALSSKDGSKMEKLQHSKEENKFMKRVLKSDLYNKF